MHTGSNDVDVGRVERVGVEVNGMKSEMKSSIGASAGTESKHVNDVKCKHHMRLAFVDDEDDRCFLLATGRFFLFRFAFSRSAAASCATLNAC